MGDRPQQRLREAPAKPIILGEGKRLLTTPVKPKIFDEGNFWVWMYKDHEGTPYIWEKYTVVSVDGANVVMEMSNCYDVSQSFLPHHRFELNLVEALDAHTTHKDDGWSFRSFRCIYDGEWLEASTDSTQAFSEKFNLLPLHRSDDGTESDVEQNSASQQQAHAELLLRRTDSAQAHELASTVNPNNFTVEYLTRTVAGLGNPGRPLFLIRRRDTSTDGRWRNTDSWYIQDLDGETSLGGVAAYKRFNEGTKHAFTFELFDWKVGPSVFPGGPIKGTIEAWAEGSLRGGRPGLTRRENLG
eukprot:FR738813.1.p1 GENE.FR738813.1~~FR738813.1.p1  ORF type:complete len:300 (+),score=26.34 FR738813.1:3-902(+)